MFHRTLHPLTLHPNPNPNLYPSKSMTRLSLSFLLLFSVLHMAGVAEPAVTKPQPYAIDFIKVSCTATRYPKLCVQSLAAFADLIRQSPRQLAQTALTVSLARARSAVKLVSKMTRVKGMKAREYRAVKDCLEEMVDSVDRLSRSVHELGRMGRTQDQDFMWHMSNVQTWVSAALTDENTCLDGFAGRSMDGRVKAAMRAEVVNIAQVTSNALALVNRFAARQ